MLFTRSSHCVLQILAGLVIFIELRVQFYISRLLSLDAKVAVKKTVSQGSPLSTIFGSSSPTKEKYSAASKKTEKTISSDSDDNKIANSNKRNTGIIQRKDQMKEAVTVKAPESSVIHKDKSEVSAGSGERTRGSFLKMQPVQKINKPAEANVDVKAVRGGPKANDTTVSPKVNDKPHQNHVLKHLASSAGRSPRADGLLVEPVSLKTSDINGSTCSSDEEIKKRSLRTEIQEDVIPAQELKSSESAPFDLLDVLSETAVDSEEDLEKAEKSEDEVVEESLLASVTRHQETNRGFDFTAALIEKTKIDRTMQAMQTPEDKGSEDGNRMPMREEKGLESCHDSDSSQLAKSATSSSDSEVSDAAMKHVDKYQATEHIEAVDTGSSKPSKVSEYQMHQAETDAHECDDNGSVNNDAFTSSEVDASDGDDQSETDSLSENQTETKHDTGLTGKTAKKPDKKAKKTRKILKTKSGHIVRTRSLFGLRNRSDPNRLSYVEECEWLDTLVQIELETIEKRKLAESLASVDIPKPKANTVPIEFNRSEAIDEESLNLVESRALVKGLLDMEMEGRKGEGSPVILREKSKRKKDKAFLARRKSMPVGKDAIHAAEVIEVLDNARNRRKQSESGDLVEKGPKQPKTSDQHVLESRNEDIDVRARFEGGKKVDSSEEIKIVKEVHAKKPIAAVIETAKDIGRAESEPNAASNGSTQSVDDSKPLTNIKDIKNMFEQPAAKRPIDKYRSMSLDVKPHSHELTRSKSVGHELIRPSEDNDHIVVVEKNASSAGIKTDRKNDGNFSKKLSTGQKDCSKQATSDAESSVVSSVVNSAKDSSETKSDKVNLSSHKAEEEEEKSEDTGTLKRVGDFKQFFEAGQAKDLKDASSRKNAEPIREKHKLVKSDAILDTKADQQIQSAQLKEKLWKDQDKQKKLESLGKETRSELPLKANDKEHCHEQEMRVRDVSEKEISSGHHNDVAAEEMQGEEEAIPSIKDRLALFQAEKAGNNASPKKTVIRKERPQSFHGSTFDEHRSTDVVDAKVADCKADTNEQAQSGQVGRKGDASVSKLGEMMLGGNSDGLLKINKKQTATKKEAKQDSLSTAGRSKDEIKTNVVKVNDNNDEKVDGPTYRKLVKGDVDDGSSYRKMVKDDRIRRELAEQEEKDLEIRRQKVLRNQKSFENEASAKIANLKSPTREFAKPAENNTKSVKEFPTDYRSFLAHKETRNQESWEKEANTQGLKLESPTRSTVKSTESHTMTSVTGSPTHHRSLLQKDWVRKELEDQERRENELKQRTPLTDAPDTSDNSISTDTKTGSESKDTEFTNRPKSIQLNRFSSEDVATGTTKVATAATKQSNPVEESGSPSNYRSFVQNERVRKELEEQEMRENELKQRAALVNNIATNTASDKNVEQRPGLETDENQNTITRKEANRPSNETASTGVNNRGPKSLSSADNPLPDYRLLVKNERVRKELEEQEKRENELKQRPSMKSNLETATHDKTTTAKENSVQRNGKNDVTIESSNAPLNISTSEKNSTSPMKEKRAASLKVGLFCFTGTREFGS